MEAASARGSSRRDAMNLMLSNLDKQALVEVHNWTPERLMYFDETTLRQEKEMYLSTCQGKSSPKDIACVTFRSLISEATKNQNQGPWSVTDKPEESVAPSGDKHDYYNPAPYHWPPPWWSPWRMYVKRDGLRRPGTEMYGPDSDLYDRSRLQAMINNVTVWSLASYFTDEEHYATKAAEAVDTWFVNPKTRMNPHLEWSQAIGPKRGKGYGVIETKDFYFFLDALRLLQQRGSFSPEQSKSLQDWFSTFLEYLKKDSQGLNENKAKNNHGLYYDVQVAAIAAFTNNSTVLSETIHQSTSRLWIQVASDGSMPHELARPTCEHYQAFTLSGWQILARMAIKAGVNLWKDPVRIGEGDKEQSSLLCKVMSTANPYHTKRALCDGNIEEIDERRWWPLALSTRSECPSWLSQNDQPAAWLREKALPTSKYQMPSMYFEHDGIAPFWNIGNPHE